MKKVRLVRWIGELLVERGQLVQLLDSVREQRDEAVEDKEAAEKELARAGQDRDQASEYGDKGIHALDTIRKLLDPPELVPTVQAVKDTVAERDRLKDEAEGYRNTIRELRLTRPSPLDAPSRVSASTLEATGARSLVFDGEGSYGGTG